MENNLRVDKFVTQEFLVHTVYGAQVVVTNPTSTPRVLSALLQLPVGALPVKGAKYTGSQVLQLEPYATATIEYLFYFPAAGDYAHYPVHVARDGKLVAQAEAFTFHVVDAPSSLDHESWEYVSQYASADEVLDYLRKTNLNRIDLSRIAWRLREESFFNSVVDLLDSRRHYDSTVWSYSVVHNQARRLSQFLSSEEGFVSKCGLVLQSPLLRIDPVERGTWQQLEYKPLVNARAHQLGPVRRILNDRLKTQYELLMSVLSQRNSLSDRERLAVTYYLLLQDRVGEALSHFRKVDAEHLTSHLQHDYFAAYLDFYSEGLDVARRIVAKYADYPVVRWRDVFAGMAKQIGEVDGGGRPDPDSVDPRDRDAAIAALAAADCSFDVSVESANVKIEFENLEEIRVNYYLMDVELLFSQNPFVKQHSGQFAYVKPNRTQTLRLPASQKILSFELPQDLQNQNVMIEVTARGKRQSAAYYSNSMSVQLMENYGQLRVAVSDGKMALPGVYVKAYARMKDGSVKFYKDGYADLRGRFDYASLSTNALDNVDRFSLLILSDSHGATVREIAPPAR